MYFLIHKIMTNKWISHSRRSFKFCPMFPLAIFLHEAATAKDATIDALITRFDDIMYILEQAKVRQRQVKRVEQQSWYRDSKKVVVLSAACRWLIMPCGCWHHHTSVMRAFVLRAFTARTGCGKREPAGLPSIYLLAHTFSMAKWDT